MASFEIMDNDDVSRVDFVGTVDCPVDRGVAQVKTICHALSIPTDGLDKAAAQIDPKRGFEDDSKHEPVNWGTRVERNGVEIDLSFGECNFFDHTSVQVNMTMMWADDEAKDDRSAPPHRLIRDLKPPPGYEGVSMDLPRRPLAASCPALEALVAMSTTYKKKQIAGGNITEAELSGPPPFTLPWAPDQDYVAGESYLWPNHKPDPWVAAGGDLARLDDRVQRLLELDRKLKELFWRQKERMSLFDPAKNIRPALILDESTSVLKPSIENLDSLLLQAYAGIDGTFQAHPDPFLLKQMLCHYHLYVVSTDKRWPAIIAALEKVDPAVTAEAKKEVEAFRKANPKFEINLD